MTPQRNLALVLGATLATTVGILLANWHFDPFALRNAGTETSVPAGGRIALKEPFFYKAFAVRHVKPVTVILGTSRADAGLDSAHPGFAEAARPVYNLAVPGASIHQIRELLVHAQRTHPLRLAVIGLDMEAFLSGGRGDFDAAILAGNRDSAPEWLNWMRLNLSWHALGTTAQLLAAPRQNEMTATPQPVARRQVFRDAEFSNFQSRLTQLFMRWGPRAQWSSDPRRAESMRALGELLTFARSEGIELRLFISPVHARYLEMYRRVGWWPMFEAWKRALTATVAAEASPQSGNKAYALWDFTGFNAMTMEAVPPIKDTATAMRWYTESSHYTRAHGNVILDRILERAAGADDPGVLIDARNIDAHLSRIQEEARRFQSTFPGEVAEVATLAGFLRHYARK